MTYVFKIFQINWKLGQFSRCNNFCFDIDMNEYLH